MAMASSSSHSGNRSRNRVLPTHCKCNIRLARRVSWTQRNPGRRFLVCPRPSLYDDWYKIALYEMYVSMNPNQRELFEHKANQHEREIKSQQRIAALEEELKANSNMVDELKRAKSDVGRWRKISTFLLFLLCVMFLLLLVVL
ncbi:hypothetical protein Tco_1125864 [Tanacetum coccineum]